MASWDIGRRLVSGSRRRWARRRLTTRSSRRPCRRRPPPWRRAGEWTAPWNAWRGHTMICSSCSGRGSAGTPLDKCTIFLTYSTDFNCYNNFWNNPVYRRSKLSNIALKYCVSMLRVARVPLECRGYGRNALSITFGVAGVPGRLFAYPQADRTLIYHPSIRKNYVFLYNVDPPP